MKFKLFWILVFGFWILAMPALAAHGDRLVPCGYSELEGDEMLFIPCTPCHLWQLASNIVNFLLFHLALPILAVAILAGGIVWLTSSGNPDQIKKGKAILTSSIIGIFIAFGGWLIVDTIIKTLGAGELRWSWQEVARCPIPRVPTTPTTGGTPSPTFINEFEANRDAAGRLANSGVTFSGGGSCVNTNGQNVSAATNLDELRREEPLTVCQNGCSTTVLRSCARSSFTLSPRLLPALFLTRQSTNVDFTITSLTTGEHALNSDHYSGNAADIVPGTPSQANYIALRTQLRVFSPGTRVECEDNRGNVILNCGQGTTHLHTTVR